MKNGIAISGKLSIPPNMLWTTTKPGTSGIMSRATNPPISIAKAIGTPNAISVTKVNARTMLIYLVS
ncbi:hypothetical protein D3C86_1874130 [compost metagenome]